MALIVRPLTLDDLEAVAEVERLHLGRHAGEPFVSAASLRYYERSGHAFVADDNGRCRGFALGRALWDGARATVTVERLAAADGEDAAAFDALLGAVTKSAYDAGVYRLELRLVHGAETALDRCLASDYLPADISILTRTLGSRGR